MEKLNNKEIEEIIRLHHLWLRGEDCGKKADFINKEISYDFVDVDLSHADFSFSNLVQASFTGITLRKANFMGSNCTGTEFAKANLEEANFHSSNCSAANFEEADVRDANFKKANLYDADFYLAKISNADFLDSHRKNADFREVIGVYKGEFACEHCEDTGIWLDSADHKVERCDQCQRFANDDEAFEGLCQRTYRRQK